ncbi:hypothetical protein ACFL35_13935 [Candidatus Riflebacteria bacterium]
MKFTLKFLFISFFIFCAFSGPTMAQEDDPMDGFSAVGDGDVPNVKVKVGDPVSVEVEANPQDLEVAEDKKIPEGKRISIAQLRAAHRRYKLQENAYLALVKRAVKKAQKDRDRAKKELEELGAEIPSVPVPRALAKTEDTTVEVDDENVEVETGETPPADKSGGAFKVWKAKRAYIIATLRYNRLRHFWMNHNRRDLQLRAEFNKKLFGLGGIFPPPLLPPIKDIKSERKEAKKAQKGARKHLKGLKKELAQAKKTLKKEEISEEEFNEIKAKFDTANTDLKDFQKLSKKFFASHGKRKKKKLPLEEKRELEKAYLAAKEKVLAYAGEGDEGKEEDKETENKDKKKKGKEKRIEKMEKAEAKFKEKLDKAREKVDNGKMKQKAFDKLQARYDKLKAKLEDLKNSE